MRSEHSRPVHVGGAWRVILNDLGLDQVAILRRAGLPPTLFEGEGAYISIDDFYALHAAVEAESDDPTIALRGGKIVSIELFDPALFAAICSENLNTAAGRLGQFKRLVGAFSLDVHVGDTATTVRYRCKRRPDIPRLLGLTEMVFQGAFARRATRHHVVPLRVTVQRLPTDLAPYEAFFGCSLRQGDACAVVFAAEDGVRPFLTHNARMWESFEPSLRRRMAEASASRSTTDQVASVLFELLPSGRAQMSDVARALGVGVRTLQRRLGAEDSTWLSVLNQTRERLACHYLRATSMSPAEIGFLLGFTPPDVPGQSFVAPGE